MTELSPLGRAALDYAAAGLAVFPLAPRSKAPLFSEAAGGRGFHDATTDADTIRRWWTASPRANIGGVPASAGLVAVDIDGADELSIAQQLGLLAEPTRTVVSGRGGGDGLHLYFRADATRVHTEVRGLTVRADRGFIVMPPSVHPSGTPYRWEDESVPVADLPAAALAAMADDVSRDAIKGRTRSTILSGTVREGGRHITLLIVAGHLAGKKVDEDIGAALVHAYNAAHCTPPQPTADVDRIVRDIWAKERAKAPTADLSALTATPTPTSPARARLDSVRRQLLRR